MGSIFSGGGEIGMGSIFSGGGEIGMGSIFSGGGEIGMGSIFSGGGEIGMGSIFSGGGEIGMGSIFSGGGEIGMGSIFSGGGEIGMGSIFSGGGEIGMGSIFSGGGEIGMGSIFSGGGEIGMGSIFSGGGEIGAVGLGRGVSLVDSGESLQVFEFTTGVSEGLRMIVGYGRIRVLVVVAVVVVTRGAAATGGAVLFGHLAANERGQERRRGVGLSSALQEQDFEHVGVPEDGNFESCLEAEGVVGLPMQGCGDGYTGFIGSEAYDVGPSVLIEIYRLPYPGVAIFGSEVYEPDAEVAFEFGGLVVGADSEFLEEGVHGFWDLGAG